MTRSGLLRRLLTALSLAAALAFSLDPLVALASQPRHDGGVCLEASIQHPAASSHHGGSAHSSCCGMLCVPALAADEASVPPPDSTPTGAIHPADVSETGIELNGPSPPPRP